MSKCGRGAMISAEKRACLLQPGGDEYGNNRDSQIVLISLLYVDQASLARGNSQPRMFSPRFAGQFVVAAA